LIHILHLEDNPVDAELVQATLEETDLVCQIRRVQARDEFEGVLRQEAIDIILADYQLPGYDGMSALRLVLEVCPAVPFIFVSGALGEEAAIDALTQGATDYVLKENLSRLVPSVRRAFQEAQNRREHARAEQQVEHQRLANLQYFESMDRIDRAIQGARDIDAMMSAVLDAVLSIFNGDRAYLMHPCDPKAATWTAPMERTRPDYSGVLTLGLVMPMTPEVAATIRILLASDHPVQFGPGTGHPLPPDVAERFDFKSFMAVALYPKVGRPWQFGLHQCAHVHIWSLEEERKFQEIGRRLADGLTSWITHRDLQISERRYRRLNQELEQRVAERTQALEASHADLEKAYRDLQTAHSRMLQQEKMASIGQLAAGVAHEINNPLSYIVSNLSALGDYSRELAQFQGALKGALRELTVVSPENDASAVFSRLQEEREVDFILADIEQLVAESMEGGKRMQQIVENLKSFARLDETGYKMADLNQGLETTLNMVWNEIKNKAKVNRSYGDIPQIMCNPGQLNQVFMNLLLNAVQAIEHQGAIDIATRQAENFIFVTIADTGGGILPDQVDRIFEPFFTTKEVGKGTGLGLSIAYDIVKKHGGEITVESRSGQGTRFTIQLPIQSQRR
jgi:signal transduction histidine kinase/DNA-binding response OmpR family regulator